VKEYVRARGDPNLAVNPKVGKMTLESLRNHFTQTNRQFEDLQKDALRSKE